MIGKMYCLRSYLTLILPCTPTQPTQPTHLHITAGLADTVTVALSDHNIEN